MLKTIINSFRLAFLNIRNNFFHTFLSVLGIVIGVASLVGVLSLIDGMESFARDQIAQTTSLNAIEIRPNINRNVNGVQIQKEQYAYLNYDRIKELKLSKPTTTYARTASSAEVNVFSLNKTIGARAHAALHNIVPDLKASSGKLFSEKNVDQADSVVVVNAAFAKACAIDEKEIIGKKIKVNNLVLEIIGMVGEERNTTPQLYYPITLLSENQLQQSPPVVDLMAVKTEDVPALKQEVIDWLDKNFAENKDDFQVVTNEFRVEQAARGFLLFRIIMGLIVGISVVVGGVGVMNVLLISVTERTAEIGVRKAVGANRKHIALQFLSESVTISTFGSLLGLILGVLGTMAVVPIVKSITKIPFQAIYTWNTIVVVSVIAVLVGIIFGTYPALRASRLNPVDAIRHE